MSVTNWDTLSTVEQACLPRIESELSAFLERMSSDGIGWNAEMSRYHFSTGGKRLRALIPCQVYAAFGVDPTRGVRLGCALELIHNATLVHDDLQDRDTVRRGKPTVWRKYSDEQSVNCGDSLFQFAFEMLYGLELPAEALVRVMRRLTRTTLLTIEGQAQEFLMKDEESPGLARYLGVVRQKTAALISAAVVAPLEALQLCDSDPAILRFAEEAALQAGVLFQLQDDLLDLYGEKQRDRKATDIAEGKISVLIAILNERASAEERSRITAILRAPRENTTQAQIEEILALIERYQVRQAALDQVRRIEGAIWNHPEAHRAPGLHRCLLELTARFLDPVRLLL